jgi:hypothetical protein
MLYLVKQLELAVRSRLDEVLRPESITPLQYTALTVLERRSDLSTAEPLILRHTDPGDRRRPVLRLTARGQKLLDRVRADVEAVEERMLSPLAAGEVDHLRRYVTACRAALASSPPH